MITVGMTDAERLEREQQAAVLQELALIAVQRGCWGVLGVSVEAALVSPLDFWDVSVVVKLRPWARHFFWPDLVRAWFELSQHRSSLVDQVVILDFTVLS